MEGPLAVFEMRLIEHLRSGLRTRDGDPEVAGGGEAESVPVGHRPIG